MPNQSAGYVRQAQLAKNKSKQARVDEIEEIVGPLIAEHEGLVEEINAEADAQAAADEQAAGEAAAGDEGASGAQPQPSPTTEPDSGSGEPGQQDAQAGAVSP